MACLITCCLQAREAAEILKRYKIDKLVSSPFVRCLQTAKELERELPNSPVAEIAFPFSEVGRLHLRAALQPDSLTLHMHESLGLHWAKAGAGEAVPDRERRASSRPALGVGMAGPR